MPASKSHVLSACLYGGEKRGEETKSEVRAYMDFVNCKYYARGV
jgi:hypothetical protein